jgi:predicted kinase
MQKVIIMKGLPGSGKSTWALKFVKDNLEYKRINNDDLRRMFQGDNFGSKSQEKFISAMRDDLIRTCLSDGYSVIVDNTNLNPKRVEQIKQLVETFNSTQGLLDIGAKKITIEIKDFTHVPLKECIKNDLKRLHSVGKDVIMQMYNQYLKQKTELLKQDQMLPKAIICDLDGTLALLNGRNPYDASTCENDLINIPVLEILRKFKDKYMIIFCSGREDKYLIQTYNFLKKCDNSFKYLLMRKTGDFRKDAIIKKEIFDEHIKDKYYVEFVLDDRNQVVEMWRELGLTCLQVREGDF